MTAGPAGGQAAAGTATETQRPKLSVRQVSHEFARRQGPLPVLRDVSLAIYPGEFVVLLGPSGCGKSTLLNIAGGLERPSAGWVEMDGQRVSGPGPDRSMVFQQYALFPWLTVEGNVEFGLRLKGLGRSERKAVVEEVLGLVDLLQFRHAWPKELSGGMKQRAAIARAYALDPEVLLMDEPFAAVDALTRLQLQEDLAATWLQRRRTVLFVTHDIDEAIWLGSRVVVFSGRPGRILKVLDIDIPVPREPAARTMPRFTEYRQELLEVVRAGMADGSGRAAG
jgi:NitT/TauT family transport system ATP-binding protein